MNLLFIYFARISLKFEFSIFSLTLYLILLKKRYNLKLGVISFPYVVVIQHPCYTLRSGLQLVKPTFTGVKLNNN